MSGSPLSRYEMVIGLEVHAQLRTESKLFSPARVSFGDEPNHNVEPVCLALPGVLPVLNRRAVECAILAGIATHCTVHTRSIFARKHYFYPDLPKGYQISQFEHPIATGGWVDIQLDGGAEAVTLSGLGLLFTRNRRYRIWDIRSLFRLSSRRAGRKSRMKSARTNIENTHPGNSQLVLPILHMFREDN